MSEELFRLLFKNINFTLRYSIVILAIIMIMFLMSKLEILRIFIQRWYYNHLVSSSS